METKEFNNLLENLFIDVIDLQAETYRKSECFVLYYSDGRKPVILLLDEKTNTLYVNEDNYVITDEEKNILIVNLCRVAMRAGIKQGLQEKD